MTRLPRPQISVVVPVYNENPGLRHFHDSLLNVLDKTCKNDYEVIYVDDGSTDETAKLVREFNSQNPEVKLLALSRNFGKENALSAGIGAAVGQAVITIDGDNQHPVTSIPDMIKLWQNGTQVVIGVRKPSTGSTWFKRLSSWGFYRLFNHLTSRKLLPNSTDFRLIDSSVQEAFSQLGESDRITRGLIDWLGFRREYLYFEVGSRAGGKSSYDHRSLIKLATNSLVSLTPRPLYLCGYLGIAITLGALGLGLAITLEQLILGDPLHWKFTGTAMLGILTLFLVGIVLLSQGILALYISHTHSQTLARPLYIIDYASSKGIAREQNRL